MVRAPPATKIIARTQEADTSNKNYNTSSSSTNQQNIHIYYINQITA